MNIEFGDTVKVDGYEGEVIEIDGDKVLIHFGGDALHFVQEWHNLDDIEENA